MTNKIYYRESRMWYFVIILLIIIGYIFDLVLWLAMVSVALLLIIIIQNETKLKRGNRK